MPLERSVVVALVAMSAVASAPRTVADLADPLHYGALGDSWTKAVWFLFGLLLTGMFTTGFLIWSTRTFKEIGQPARARAAAGMQEPGR